MLSTTVEALSKAPESDGEAAAHEMGNHRSKVSLNAETRLNFELVMRHYGVAAGELINAAPWMFTLLAEASLAERRRCLEEATAAFEEAMDRLPIHLSRAASARTDFDEAHRHEINSIAARDLFGTKLAAESPTFRGCGRLAAE